MQNRSFVRVAVHFVITVSGAVLLGDRTAAAQARLQGLGDLPGGVFDSVGYGIAGSGHVAFAAGSSVEGTQAFRWVEGTGVRNIGGFNTIPFDASFDGSVVVGWGLEPGGGTSPFRWEQSTGLEYLPVGGQAFGVSQDGSIVVGYTYTGPLTIEAFRWTRAEGVVLMGDLPGGEPRNFTYGSSANKVVVTPDGPVIVGGGWGVNGGEAFRWTPAAGMAPLGDLPGGQFGSGASDVTPDGRVIVGTGHSANGAEAFRWTQETGMVGLGDLPGGEFESLAFDVSADGSVVVGTGRSAQGNEAFVWDAAHGMRTVRQALAAAGVSTAGWRLIEAYGVSDDGTRISGFGINPRGQNEAYLAVLPEPGGAALLAALLAPLLARPRRRRVSSPAARA